MGGIWEEGGERVGSGIPKVLWGPGEKGKKLAILHNIILLVMVIGLSGV